MAGCVNLLNRESQGLIWLSEISMLCVEYIFVSCAVSEASVRGMGWSNGVWALKFQVLHAGQCLRSERPFVMCEVVDTALQD